MGIRLAYVDYVIKKYTPTEVVKAQLMKLDNEGIDVKEPGASIYKKTKQVSWQNLIDALQKYIDNYQSWTADQCRSHWCQQVGGAQLILPAHVINEYSRPDRSYIPCPAFNELVLPRIGIPGWSKQEQYILGSTFAWVRGSGNDAWRYRGGDGLWIELLRGEMAAMATLFKTRTEQSVQLISSVTHTIDLANSTPSISWQTKLRNLTGRVVKLKPVSHTTPVRSTVSSNQNTTSTTVLFSSVIQNVSKPSASSLSRSSLPQTLPTKATPIVNPQDLAKFLKHIGFGEQNEAEAMLKTNIALALAPSNFADCAKRQFNQVTGFQYAVWALDWYMWTMIKKYMPEEAIKEQLIKLDKEGIAAKDPGANSYKKTKQVSWQNLIDALQKYIDNYQLWTAEQCQSHWCQQVGGAQLILPAHVINEYSRPDRPFDPCPEFNERQTLPRTDIVDWRVKGGLLGKDFAWVRAGVRGGMVVRMDCGYRFCNNFGRGWMQADHEAVCTLSNTRVEQRAQLISSVTLGTKPTLKP